ncbi:longitudinals lacking protein, isoforms N/O/W/X/Y [Eurosta solidaginis]|uniref:longitudinals lacking protein, isoforms N/O/W/X/Y n=1 Tax=Eurosta solidaginis TaxID=178769 RepID=UPI003530FFFE
MSVQQFCLRWNNHQPNFISVCSSLLHNGTLVDVTLAAEGRQLQAHKIVLSACSSYFQTLFTSNPCQHPIVILKDVQYDDLKTMVDFMYYGEVNVSQEQLPHILKTAEMLKIKGLAEMPTDPANLTKSESKSSSEPADLMGSGSSGSNGQSSSGVASGGLGSSAGGSMNDALWEQQHHHQHSETQFQSHHHQQQQNNQTQTSQQQHHQLRRTPSPLGSGASPATRRKRLRKSSNNGSGDRTNSEEQHNSSLDSGNPTGGISLTQMGQMSFGANAISGMPTNSLHTTKLLKESTSTNVDPHQHDDSLDDGHAHVHMHIKPEVDMSSVQQSIPLDISGATTPSEHDAPNSQSSHSGLQWTVVDSNYSRFSLSTCQPNLIGNSGGGNSGGNQQSSNNSNAQHQQRQHTQDAAAQQSAAGQQQQHFQQLHYQQQQQQQQQQQAQQQQQNAATAYSPQIITVNSLVSNYGAAGSAAQNLSPTSPNESMVQSVYSQGPTPIQSPVHTNDVTGNASGSGASNISANNTGTSAVGGGNNVGGVGVVNSSSVGNTNSGSGGNQVAKRKRSVNPQGDENFIRALEAVRSGGIGFCKAARLYGVNNRTLWLEYKKRGYPVSRPSIKARVVKQEPNMSPSPTPPNAANDDTTNENYEHLTAAVAAAAAQSAALNMQIPPSADTPTSSVMCTPHHVGTATGTGSAHPAMGVMNFLDPRHMDFSAAGLHTVSRQRYIDATSVGAASGAGTINVNTAAAMNLQSINFNSI